MATKTFLIELELTPTQTKSISAKVPGDYPDSYKIAGVAKGAMLDIADGGFVVDGKVAKQIEALTGPIGDAQDLVSFVERGVGREDGATVVTWKADPVYLPLLEQAAQSQGSTVQEVMQGLMDYACGQGWLYDINPESKVLFLSREDAKAMAEILGTNPGNVTGTDMADFIRRSVELPQLDVAGAGR